MFPTLSLLSTLLLALSVAANPVLLDRRAPLTTLSVAKSINFTGAQTVLQADQARVRNLRARAQAKISGVSLSADAGTAGNVQVENAVVSYLANVSPS